MEGEVLDYRREALKFCWNMRGGLNYSQAMMLSAADRKIILKIIDENIEITKASKLPYF